METYLNLSYSKEYKESVQSLYKKTKEILHIARKINLKNLQKLPYKIT